jgi:hypothetical protein
MVECEWCKSVYTEDQSSAIDKSNFCSYDCQMENRQYELDSEGEDWLRESPRQHQDSDLVNEW